ncbi:STAS/SEC14 domain-containing protein [Aquibacillus koreensis]|uniref:STAS/SEC14 domain-containing protein n=1 Tax=Aquibacillus koreensis TaxID=279446 RepID=A0A9X3WPM3_9BACI|nr:STAS/SEC14 domain-containing protein [Aquibacillus koreensis]MCT2537844.1 STAS/SEC14 domain-containing protein [Aquibacillus koreensis]MDC3421124.1 STAS/SEC14 domain-containing protein [Aquibacillus koreensis]
MLSIKTNDMPKVMELEIGGKVTEEDIKEFKNYFKQKEKEYDVFNVVITVNKMEYSFEGFIEELKFEANHLDKFNKVAVISDKKWVNAIGKLTNQIPNIEVENFDVNERGKALEWASHE